MSLVVNCCNNETFVNVHYEIVYIHIILYHYNCNYSNFSYIIESAYTAIQKYESTGTQFPFELEKKEHLFRVFKKPCFLVNQTGEDQLLPDVI